MKKRNLLTKTLLAVAMLGAGVSDAWADWTTVYSNDYTDASTYADGWTNGNSGRIAWGQWTRPDLAESVTDKTAMRVYMSNSNNGANATFNGLSSVSAYTSSEKYKIEFDFGLSRGSSQNPSFVIYASDNSTVLVTFQATTSAGKRTFTTKAGNEGTFYSPSETYNSFNLTDNSPSVFNHVVIEADATNGTKITVSSDGGGTDANVVEEHTVVIDANMLYVGKMVYNTGRYNSHLAIDNLSVSVYSDTEIVPEPSAAITGVNGTDRTVTMTLGTGSSNGTVIKYYTDTESKSDLTTYSAPFTVSTTSTIHYYAESTSGVTSNEQDISVSCVALTLNTPTITRSSNTTVTITDDQSNLDASPASTIYYSYNGSEYAEYTGAITVSADDIITAYATSAGYTNSKTESRAVALFPTAITQIEDMTTPSGSNNNPSYTTGAFSETTYTGEKATYAAYLLDGTQLGTNVYLQTSGWGFRNNGSWYTNSTSSVWLMMKDMQAGDIIVAQFSQAAGETANATYSEKYSYEGNHAYVVDADGDVELGFTRVSSSANNYFFGIYAYRPVTSVSAPITAAGYATFSSTYALDFSEVEDLTAWIATANDGETVTLTQVEGTVAAGTGLVVKGSTADIPVAATGTDYSATNKLVAVSSETEVSSGYVLSQQDGKVVFAPISGTNATVAAGHAYLQAAGGSRALNIVFGEGTTGVDASLVKSEENIANSAIYNLNGQRVSQPRKGLYIVDGRKVTVK